MESGLLLTLLATEPLPSPSCHVGGLPKYQPLTLLSDLTVVAFVPESGHEGGGGVTLRALVL